MLLRCHLQPHGCCHLKMPPMRGVSWDAEPGLVMPLMNEPAPAAVGFGFLLKLCPCRGLAGKGQGWQMSPEHPAASTDPSTNQETNYQARIWGNKTLHF